MAASASVSASMSMVAASGIGSPCGACKFLRRKCAPDCVFAPYFDSNDSPAQFAAIHKVFGASNVSKLLSQLPAHHRCDAIAAVAYEAQARIRDPVYGCVGHIFALQKQVAILQEQLMQVRVQVAQQKEVSQVVDEGLCAGALIVQPHMNYSETKQEIVCPKRWIDHGMDCSWSARGVVAQPVQVGACMQELAVSAQELWKKRAVPQHEYYASSKLWHGG